MYNRSYSPIKDELEEIRRDVYRNDIQLDDDFDEFELKDASVEGVDWIETSKTWNGGDFEYDLTKNNEEQDSLNYVLKNKIYQSIDEWRYINSDRRKDTFRRKRRDIPFDHEVLIERLKDMAFYMEALFDSVDDLENNKELNIARIKLEECVMWGVKGLC
jgi:hypothetical protein